MLHRLVWPELLDRQGRARWARLQSWLTEVMHSYFLPPEDDLGWSAASRVLPGIADLARRGEEASRAILGLARDPSVQPVRLWQKTQTFKDIDPALHRLALELPEAASFIDFFFQEQRGSQNRTMLPLARELARAYRFLASAGACSWEAAGDLGGVWGLYPCPSPVAAQAGKAAPP
jgi:hypothetical protein